MDDTISEPAPTRPQAVPQGPDPALNGQRPAEPAPLADIYLDEHVRLRDLTAKVLDAMALANKGSPRLFQRDGALVRVLHRPRSVIEIEPLDVDRLRHELDLIADFYEPAGVNPKTKQTEYEPAYPPVDLVRNVMAAGEWPLPAIVGVTRVPIVREDWSIATTPGHDPGSGLWYAPVGTFALRLPEAPGQDEARTAAAAILDVLADFPFDGDASRANALALLLTMVLRPCIPGCAPLAVVDAPTPGSGKGLLLGVLWLIATGEHPAPENLPENEEELRKKITALLVRGDTLVLFDNVSHFITSDVLCAVLTAGAWSDRVLGLSKLVTVPQRATWSLTGNNVQVGRDMLRRVYRIRIDTGVEHPERRSGFRHPDLEQHVVEQRGELLGAALTIWLAWNLADRPQAPERPVMGGFQPWASLMADLLHFAGVPGFLANREQDDEANDEAREWAEFLAAWSALYGDRPMLIADLVEELKAESSSLRTALPTPFIESLKRDDLAKRLGNTFKRQTGIPRGERQLRLVRSGFSRSDRVRWRVIDPADRSAQPDAQPDSVPASAWERGDKGASPPPDVLPPAAFLGDDLLAYLPVTTRELPVARRAVAAYAHSGYRQVELSISGESRARCSGRVLFERLAILIDSGDEQHVTYAYAMLRWLAEGVGDPPAMPAAIPDEGSVSDAS
jgi:hypothetical protein